MVKKDTYLYVMKNEFDLYKIGISNKPDRRLRQISCSSGVSVKLIFLSIPDTRVIICALEAYLHEENKEHREKGEWFNSNFDMQSICTQIGSFYKPSLNVLSFTSPFKNPRALARHKEFNYLLSKSGKGYLEVGGKYYHSYVEYAEDHCIVGKVGDFKSIMIKVFEDIRTNWDLSTSIPLWRSLPIGKLYDLVAYVYARRSTGDGNIKCTWCNLDLILCVGGIRFDYNWVEVSRFFQMFCCFINKNTWFSDELLLRLYRYSDVVVGHCQQDCIKPGYTR